MNQEENEKKIMTLELVIFILFMNQSKKKNYRIFMCIQHEHQNINYQERKKQTEKTKETKKTNYNIWHITFSNFILNMARKKK